MSYKDEQHGGHDNQSTQDGLNFYSTEESSTETSSEHTQEQHAQQTKGTATSQSTETSSRTGKQSKGGLLSRLRRAMFGDTGVGNRAKSGWLSWLTGGRGLPQALLTKLASPRVLALLVAGSGLGVFGIFGIFNTYKNDDIVKNDPPLVCNQGTIEMPTSSDFDSRDPQLVVNVIYDIFHNQYNFSDEAIMGMVACMGVESLVDPDRIESDWILDTALQQYEEICGPGKKPGTDEALQAYWAYGEAFKAGGGWNHNEDGYIDAEGHMQCGVGLIAWTNGRGRKLYEGLDKVGPNKVSPMDIDYQCAFLLSEMMTDYKTCGPDSQFSQIRDPREAVRIFFTTMVSGGSEFEIDKRYACLDGSLNGINAQELVRNAAANNKYTADAVSMAQILADDNFTSAVARTAGIQLCQNKYFIDVTDIAKAAVSISFLERGDYEDVYGAYGEYRRSSRSPLIINVWNYEEGKYDTGTDKASHQDGTYGSSYGTPSSNPKSALPYYTNAVGGNGGKLDLIACTEYYYHAHLIAFPTETGITQAGYFSSCDRGTATAVRIAGADDKFPAGNPLWQLKFSVGGAKKGAQHDPDKRGSGDGFLWAFAGFLRGNDFYSASGGNAIAPGTVMISWSDDAANGYLNTGSMTGATGNAEGGDGTGGTSDSGSVFVSDSGDGSDPDYDETPTDDKMEEANRRWPFSISNTTRHIITFVGEGTVQSFWGMDWLMQQWTLFDDADRLIRGDLNVDVPQVMKDGMSYKSQTAANGSDQKYTFYQTQSQGAMDHDDVKESGISGRNTEFNRKTGLPEFKAWEEIFVRLLHNSDDDAATQLVTDEGQLYTEFETDEDNYLDDAADPDLIEQYQGEPTRGNKFFYEDWNSVGEGGTSKYGDIAEDYNTSLVAFGPDGLLYYDSGTTATGSTSVVDGDVLYWTREKNAENNPYWRYELITDVEYRMNQLMRFGMASLMCSVASEEDADVVQTGADMSNDSGHILGNLYRRYSRIPDEIDASGRFYYYNTVVSNDMLQDLVQLYSPERNGDEFDNGGGYTSRNYGPMYMLGKPGDYGYGYNSAMQRGPGASNGDWMDRRYGLTAADIEALMGGFGDNAMGMQSNDAANESIGKLMNVGLHKMSAVEKALYERTIMSESVHDGKKSHEGDHEFEEGYYDQEVYGVNPFLMLESSADNHLDYDLNEGQVDHTAVSGSTQGLRNSITGTTGLWGVDADNDRMDDRLAWIDRHYYQTRSGVIGTYAYIVASMNPSTGKRITSDYTGALRSVTTLDATGTYGAADSANLNGSRGVVRYTDYIYAENAQDNKDATYSMANRLFGNDDRYGNNNVRDDYNRREWMVVPYRHTHAQMCQHSHDGLLPTHTVENWPQIQNHCNWWDNDAACPDPDIQMIDTQSWLNENMSGSDIGDTVSFDQLVNNRGKYNIQEYMLNYEVHYFVYDGGWKELHLPTSCSHDGGDWPAAHVTCGGYNFSVPCTNDPDYPASGCCTGTCPFCGGTGDCSGAGWHTHPCHECIELKPNLSHGHSECDKGDECHDKYGCNVLEWYYHKPSPCPVYMAIATVEQPCEKMDLNKFVKEYTSGSTCYPDKHNFMQQVTYNTTGGILFSLEEIVRGPGSMADPNPDGPTHGHMTGKSTWTAAGDGGGITLGYDAGGKECLLGYFTIEGNLIRDSMGDEQSEEITALDRNCSYEDLQRIEALSVRMGYGKAINQTVNGDGSGGVTKIMVGQAGLNTASGLGAIPFMSTATADDNVTYTMYNGYGEYLVTGTQHQKDPTTGQGNYAGVSAYDMGGKTGPDGSRGNPVIGEFNSVLRDSLGDEHVAHVTFGSVSAAGLTDRSKDNGRDFMVYVDHKKIGKHFDGHGYSKDNEDDAKYYEPSYYMDPQNKCPGCGKDIMPTFTDDKDVNQQRYRNSLAFTLGPFVDMDPDGKYMDPDTGLPTPMAYYDEGAHKLSDDPVNEFGTDNAPNVYLASYKWAGTYTDNNGIEHPVKACDSDKSDNDKSTNSGDSENTGTDGEKTFTNNGDYRLWVAHASRGTRGMMTQYLNFKGFFHDVHADGPNTKEFAYMLFTNIRRKDDAKGSNDGDHDGDTKEDFLYTDKPSSAVLDPSDLNRVWGTGSVEIKNDDGKVIGFKPTSFSDTYGQGSNSHWRNMIEVYNAAMGESRQFGN